MNRLGERIKRTREKLNLPLSELSKKVGISVSALSQIENAKAFPSILTLKTIADSMFTTVGDLIGENELLTKNPLVKFGDIKYVKSNDVGASLFLLSQHENGKQMEPYMLKFEVDANSSQIMIEHHGQGFIHVLEGKLLMTLDTMQYVLEQNDSFYFNSNIKHELKNIGTIISRAIWIISPPTI